MKSLVSLTVSSIWNLIGFVFLQFRLMTWVLVLLILKLLSKKFLWACLSSKLCTWCCVVEIRAISSEKSRYSGWSENLHSYPSVGLLGRLAHYPVNCKEKRESRYQATFFDTCFDFKPPRYVASIENCTLAIQTIEMIRNRVFLSRSYRLIVATRKFVVLKTNIPVLQNVKILRGN